MKVGAGGKAFKLEGLSGETTVLEVKQKCKEQSGLAVEQQRVFLKGRQLKDEDSLLASKVADKATLFIVKGAAAAGSADNASSSVTQETDKKPAEPEEPVVTVPCEGGCGFFGTSKMDNMCSKCYNQKKAKEEKASEKKKEPEPAKEDTKDSTAPAAEGKDAEMSAEPAPPVQEDKTKCWSCSKKCGLAGFDCRCGYKFCAKHRHAEDHNCDFDHKSKGREILAETLRKAT